jgi:hypothetical protein
LVWRVRFWIVYRSVDRVEDERGFGDPAALASCDLCEVAALDKYLEKFRRDARSLGHLASILPAGGTLPTSSNYAVSSAAARGLVSAFC